MNNSVKSTISLALTILLLSACASTPSTHLSVADLRPFDDLTKAATSDAFSADKIAELEARMQKFVADGDTKGIATLLVKDGQIVSHTQAGVRRIMDGAAITEDTIYRIYSMTKPITGVALMTLYEQGMFSLDDPVVKFVPEFKNLQVVKSFADDGSFAVEALHHQPTMRELMSHTAGFAYGLYGKDPSNLMFMKNGVLASPDLNTFIDRVAAIPLMYQPGEQWFYSAAVDIQGAIVERLSGMKFGAFLASKIFAPLGMVDTGFSVPAAEYDRFSNVYGFHPETKKFQLLPFSEAQYNRLGDVSYRPAARGMESGGGGLVSTLKDYARFCQMLVNGGQLSGARILKAETIKLMRTDVLQDHQRVSIAGTLSQTEGNELGFGLDFGIFHNKGNDPLKMGDGSYFWGGAAGTWFWIDPVNNLFFIGMIQRFAQGGPEVDFRTISRDLVYQALNK